MMPSLSRRSVLVLPFLLAGTAQAREGELISDGYRLRWDIAFGEIDLWIDAPTLGWFAIALSSDRRFRSGRRFQMLADRDSLSVREQTVRGTHLSAAEAPVLKVHSGRQQDGRSLASLRLASPPGLLAAPVVYARLSWSRLRTLHAAPSWQRIVALSV